MAKVSVARGNLERFHYFRCLMGFGLISYGIDSGNGISSRKTLYSRWRNEIDFNLKRILVGGSFYVDLNERCFIAFLENSTKKGYFAALSKIARSEKGGSM